MNFDELAAEYVLPGIPSEDLKERAIELILAGYENPNLAALVVAEKDQAPADLRDLFEQALRELGASFPDRLTAGNVLKKRLARRVVSGELPPREGAGRIVSLLHELETELPKIVRYVGDSFGVAALVGLYYAYDDVYGMDAGVIGELDEGVKRACEMLARGEDVGCAAADGGSRNIEVVLSKAPSVRALEAAMDPEACRRRRGPSSRGSGLTVAGRRHRAHRHRPPPRRRCRCR